MKKTYLLLFCYLAFSVPALAQTGSLHERLSLDYGWRFHLGDIPFPVITGHSMSYGAAKAGKAWGYQLSHPR